MAISVTDTWRRGVQRRNQRLRYLAIIDDGTTQWKSLSGSCDQFSYQTGLAEAPSPVAAEVDPITREVSIGELVAQFRDKYLRPIVVNNRLKGQLLTVKIGSADIPENDFCFYASGVINKIVGDGSGNVISVSCLDAFSILNDAKITGSWVDKHLIEVLYYGDGTGILEKAGVPTALINTSTFDPGNYTSSISHWNTFRMSRRESNANPLWISEPTSAWELVAEVLFLLSGTIVIDEEGKLSFTRFDSTATPVCTWRERDIKEFDHLEDKTQIINRVIIEFFGDSRRDGRVEWEHNDTDSQSDHAFKGGSDRIYEKKYSTQWVNAWGVVGGAGGISDSDTSMSLMSHFTACFTGMRGALAGPQPTDNTISVTRPAYVMIRDSVGNFEVVKITSATTSGVGSYKYFYDENSTKQGPYSNVMTVNTMVRGQFGTTPAAWGQFAPAIDITQPIAVAENIIKRWSYGVDIVEISTSMAEFDKQLADLVYLNYKYFVAYDVDGLDGTQAFEIVKKEPRPEENKIVWWLAYAGEITPTSSYNQRQPSGWTTFDRVMYSLIKGHVVLPTVASGLEFSIDSGFDGDISAGNLIIFNHSTYIPGESFTFTASKDTYVTYNMLAGDWNMYEVTNDAAVPTKAELEIWIAKVVTDGSGITGSTDLRNQKKLADNIVQAGNVDTGGISASTQLEANIVAPAQMAREASPARRLNPNPAFRFRSRG
jgi:hypothetical protein